MTKEVKSMRLCRQPTVNDCPYLTIEKTGNEKMKRCSLPEDLICSLTPLPISQEPMDGSVEMEKEAASS